MGGFLNKPRKTLPTNVVMDSILICDGLARWSDYVHYAESRDGRYLYAVGDDEPSDWMEDPNDIQMSYSTLDIVDMFNSTRTRIEIIGDIDKIGELHGIYSINNESLVMVDFNVESHTLRQRLVIIDVQRKTAECFFYRGYQMNVDYLSCMRVGEDFICVSAMVGGQSTGYLFPTNPMSPGSAKSLAPLYTKALTHIQQFYRGGSGQGRVLLSHPFFVSNTEIGFFINSAQLGVRRMRRQQVSFLADLGTIIVCDIEQVSLSGSVCLRQTSAPASFFCPLSKARVHIDRTTQRNVGEIIMYARLERIGCAWQYNRWIVLNVKTLEWAEIMADKNKWRTHDVDGDFAQAVHSFAHGIYSVAVASTAGSSRIIGNSNHWEFHKYDFTLRFNLIRHPQRVSSLLNLSMIAVQKRGNSQPKELEELANRIY